MVKFLGPYFSKPKLNKEVEPDFSMYVELEKLFSRIPHDATVRCAIYMWNDNTGLPKKDYRDKWKDEPGNPNFVTQTFVDRARNCDTKIIFDKYNEFNHPALVKKFNLAFHEKNVIIDTRIGTNDPEVRKEMAKAEVEAKTGYMHDKFFLISELEGIGKYVIIQTTANINITQTHQFNNMVVIYDDKDIYAKYSHHWNELQDTINLRKNKKKLRPNLNIFRFEPLVPIETPAAAYFMPRDSCPVEKELHRIYEKTDGERTRIDVAMAYFTRRRVREFLLKFKEGGSKVRVLLSDEWQNVKNTVPFLRENKIPFAIVRNEHYNKEVYMLNDEIQVRDNWRGRMHHKFLLIKTDEHRIVWTGSYNYTHPGLRHNDETVLRINNPTVYYQYRHQFELLYKAEKRLHKRVTHL